MLALLASWRETDEDDRDDASRGVAEMLGSDWARATRIVTRRTAASEQLRFARDMVWATTCEKKVKGSSTEAEVLRFQRYDPRSVVAAADDGG